MFYLEIYILQGKSKKYFLNHNLIYLKWQSKLLHAVLRRVFCKYVMLISVQISNAL